MLTPYEADYYLKRRNKSWFAPEESGKLIAHILALEEELKAALDRLGCKPQPCAQPAADPDYTFMTFYPKGWNLVDIAAHVRTWLDRGFSARIASGDFDPHTVFFTCPR